MLALALTAAVGGLLLSLNVRNVGRITAVQDRLASIDRVRVLRQRLQTSLIGSAGVLLPEESFIVEDIRLQLDQALGADGFIDPTSMDRLGEARRLLSGPGVLPTPFVLRALELIGEVSDDEMAAQQRLLTELIGDARRELALGVGAVVAVGFLALVTLWLRGSRLALRRDVQVASRAVLAQHRALADAERLAAVGEMAATLAHELRNPLAGALAAIENLRREVEPDVAGRLGRVGEEIQRAVRDLNAYLSGAAQHPEGLVLADIGELAADVLQLLRHQVPRGVRLKSRFDAPIVCRVPPDRLRRAIMNLVINAVDAIGERTGHVLVEGTVEEDSLLLSVTDDGPGFPETLLASGPVAFATTRSGGTGLGLAVVQRTARDLGGSLRLENRPGGGARATLRLPCGDGRGS